MATNIDAFLTDYGALQRWLETGDPWALPPDHPSNEGRLQKLFDQFLSDALAAGVFDGAPSVPEVGQIRVATLPMPDLHAGQWNSANKRIIVLNEGLIAFNYVFVRALSTLITWAKKPVPTALRKDASLWIARLLDQAASPRTSAVVGTFPAHKNQIRWAEQVATVGECVLFGHELAHFAWGEQLASEEVPEDERGWTIEFVADILGLKAVEAFTLKHTVQPTVGLLAAELLFRALDLITVFKGKPADSTHPPPRLRINMLRDYIEKREPGIEWQRTEVGQYESMVDDLAKDALTLALEEQTSVGIKITELLHRFSTGPDLASLEPAPFRQKALAFLDVSAVATLSTLVSVLKAPLPSESEGSRYLRAMQRRVLAFETLHHVDPRTKRALGLEPV